MRATGPLCHALVPCAGTGSRIGSATPKQYLALDGRAVVAHTLEALAGVRRIASTLVVLAPDDDAFERHVSLGAGSRVAVVRCGGTTRAASVASGLERLAEGGAEPDDWVL